MNAVSFDLFGMTLLAAYSNVLKYFTLNPMTLQYVSPYTVVPGGTITSAAIKNLPATWTVATTSGPDTIVFLNRTGGTGNFAVAQTITTTSTPQTISWVGFSQTPIVGFANGTVTVFKLNTTTMQWYPAQSVVPTGFTSIAKSVAGLTRYVVCDGGTSGKVQVYYWNYTTQTIDGGNPADSLSTASGLTCSGLSMPV